MTPLLRSQAAWNEASKHLHFTFDFPRTLKDDLGREIPYVGSIPYFGSPKGVMIGFICDPPYIGNRQLASKAILMGMYFSFINLDVYAHYNEDIFKECLTDWGFFGSKTECPPWLI